MRGGGSLKASLARVFSLAKFKGCLVGLKAQPTVDSHMLTCTAMTEMDNCGECGLGFNPHQEHYRQVNLPSVLSSPNGEGNGINSITNLSPSRPNALLTKCSTLVLRLAMNAIARFCAKSSTLLSSQARLFASKACFVAPLGLAFTMAEILLSLTIIGVVAAITLPSLTGNINERTWNTQRKALYSRMSQAVALMPALNGYGIGATEEETKENATETFLSAGLSKVLKINNICDNEHLSDCGIASSFIDVIASKRNIPSDLYTFGRFNFSFQETLNGQPVGDFISVVIPNTNAAAFETANGESVVAYYNPYCQTAFQRISNDVFVSKYMCANFVYDLNGKKGPNTVGKDIGFVSVFYPNDSVVVAPFFTSEISGKFVYEEAVKKCKEKGDDVRLSNLEESMSLFLNQKITGLRNASGVFIWSSKVVSSTKAYGVDLGIGRIYAHNKTKEYGVHCVKRN